MAHRQIAVCYEFAGYRLDPHHRRLTRAGAVPVPMPPRVFDTLAYLVARAGELVEKSSLMSAVWPQTIVDENSLDRNISLLRRALGESPREHRFIVTVPGRGYRFVAAVTRRELAGAAAARAIAVLPFANLTGEPARDYLCDGIAEELIHTLTRSSGQKVAARTSSFSYKGRHIDVRQIALDLDVELVLEGSVRSTGSRLRVSCQLVDGRQGYLVWSQVMECDPDGLLELHVDIARAVIERTGVSEPTPALLPAASVRRDRETHGLYLQARSLLDRPTEQNLRGALHLLEVATRRNPDFARAWAALADVRLTALQFDYPIEDPLGRGELEARRALQLDPGLADASAALGMIHAFRGQPDVASDHFERALLPGLDPRVIALRITYITQSAGHVHSSLDEAYHAFRVGYLQPFVPICISIAHLLDGNEALSARYAEIAGRLGQPATETPLGDILTQLAWRAGRHEQARSLACAAMTPSMRAAGGEDAVALMCEALPSSSQRSRALAALTAVEKGLQAGSPGQVDLKRLMLWYTMLGAPELAHASVARALEGFARQGMVGSAWGMLWLKEMRVFREQAQFQTLARRLGFVEYWRRHGPPDGHEWRGGCLVSVPGSRS